MTAWRILCAVVVASAISAAPAYAKSAKKKIQHRQNQIVAYECFRDEDRGTRYSCGPVAQTQVRVASTARRDSKAARMAQAPRAPAIAVVSGGSSLVAEAKRYIGAGAAELGLRRTLWCAAFLDMVLKRTGHPGGGNLARGYASYGTRVSGPAVGAIAVMSRGSGGHVGVVSGVDPSGNVIVISGNHNNRVAESVYPRGRVIAYVLPGA